jgi:hypothetical protein
VRTDRNGSSNKQKNQHNLEWNSLIPGQEHEGQYKKEKPERRGFGRSVNARVNIRQKPEPQSRNEHEEHAEKHGNV